MQRADSPQAAALASEVRAFLSQKLVLAKPGTAAAATWFQALREQRWYVPHWPSALGGLDWTPRQSFILQRELLAAGALLPPGTTTHLIASWLFRALAEQAELKQAQTHQRYSSQIKKWLAGIAGDLGDRDARMKDSGSELWRVGVDFRRPDWPHQARQGECQHDRAHWVLQPFPMRTGSTTPAELASNLGEPFFGGTDADLFWAIGVLPGTLASTSVEKLNPNPSQKPDTDVELGVEQQWPPLLTGLTLVEVEALLKPIQVAWQDGSSTTGTTGTTGTPGSFAGRPAGAVAGQLGAAGEFAPGLLLPSISLGWRLVRVQQVLASDDSADAEHESLHQAQIALAALQVLEARAAQADRKRQPVLVGADLQQAVSESAERLSWQVAQLELDTLGYFALPAFDAQLQHNEGPVMPPLYDPLVAGPDS